MKAIVDQPSFLPAAPSSEPFTSFHVQRSRVIDAFADIELAIVALLLRSGTRSNGETLGQKIELLRNAKPSPSYSKVYRAEVIAQLPELERLLEFRNDIAHSKLQLATIRGEQRAVFVNSREAMELAPKTRLLSLKQLIKLRHQAAKLATLLAKPHPTPAPSLPPPAQAAKVDP